MRKPAPTLPNSVPPMGKSHQGKGDVGNAIVKTASAIFPTYNGPTGDFLLP